jgi:CCR4-NOT transcription complex subunit 3
MVIRHHTTESIDRNLKKVVEGVQAFDDLWDKFYSSSSSSHREKFEAELKKEIKKLQRLRDEIKKWINGADVKDKSSLLDARKLIEKVQPILQDSFSSALGFFIFNYTIPSLSLSIEI